MMPLAGAYSLASHSVLPPFPTLHCRCKTTMGLKDWFPFIRRNGYDPSVIHVSTMETAMGIRKGRIDVLSFYSVIRNTYSYNTPERAHAILGQHLMRFGPRSNLVLYVDGGQAVEKQHTAEIRRASREKATVQCTKSLDELERHINNNLKPRKRHFTDVRTSLAATFYWTSPNRQAFLTYMKQAGWTVRICDTEADLVIATDCGPDDIVI
ncbi:hypothetical protein BC939DRAFT_197878 [Gamsiella multidivaricata]|uniref:uncharacterized protein n=1 Tax=Gamsiella multidivaricata TaxID=101098 RepID=UPI00222001BE|nr:uncharacterized protein BC939DRAFT_197878 [Gamsiella multidivaricata]KAI7821857.1 hypothetical protein BC939DRAFT_197878 [Gamsiella multidivaricata]